ncbi:exonuclease, DNA polymerase III, epsilon subunit family [Thiohalospira halophila DSM 15071]|uniref:DNA-directed DNA polymerase n=1 Tax=Thiohalospira halophila DSM 15071 TaxID=1123397 RepID=A0A1I1U7N4_9GAMM|nr:exonuclease domain-containing protein [Thiohalospira halophila]SFD66665.1 exonuclease, DNA polymerase III, epsilon subunit family [Thiohalospira halophila DSM 15071]
MHPIFIDTETTGFRISAGHRIIQLGAVDGAGGESLWTVDPERESDDGAYAVHGLSREQLRGLPRWLDVAVDIREALDGATLIAHNAPFDIVHLLTEFDRADERPPAISGVICTQTLARRVLPDLEEQAEGLRIYSLDNLALYYGVDRGQRDQRHDALDDARILRDVYRHLERDTWIRSADPHDLEEAES